MRIVDRWVFGPMPWLTLGMVVVTFAVVVLRYVFERGWVWMAEMALYMHAFVFLLGSAYALGKDAHVRVDILYRPLSAKGRAVVDGLGSLFLLMPTCGVILYQAYPYVIDSWSVFEGSKDGGGLEAVFLLKTAIPLFCALLLLQALAILRRSVANLRQ